MLRQVPNLLSLFRIGLVPVVVVLLQEQRYGLALLVFALAGITDGVDGFIAKRFDAQTRLGAMLDPIADKLLLVSTYVMLTLGGHLPFWLLVLVIFRDVVIIGGFWMLMALGDQVEVKPSWVSKLNTFLQISLVIVVLLMLARALPLTLFRDGMVWLVALTTVISGVAYVWQGSRSHTA